MGWKAIASLPEKDLKEKLGMPKKREEPQKDKDKPENQQQGGDQGRDKDKNNKGSNGNRGTDRGSGLGQPVIPPAPVLDEDLDPDQDLDSGEETNLSWSEKRKARREEKKFERSLNKTMREEEKEKFRRAFVDKYHGNPSLLDRLALKFPKLGKFLGKDFSHLFDRVPSFEERLEEALRGLPQEERDAKAAEGIVKNLERRINQIEVKIADYEASARRKIEDAIENGDKEEAEKMGVKYVKADLSTMNLEEIESVAAMYIARGDFTRSEIEAAMKSRAASEGKGSAKYNFNDKGFNASIKSAISKQIPYLTISQLEERADFLMGLEVYTEDEFKGIQDKVAKRENKEKAELNSKLKQAREDLKLARIDAQEKRAKATEAQKEGNESKAGRTEALRDKINNGKTIATPTPKSHGVDQSGQKVEVEIVSNGSIAGGRTASATGAQKGGDKAR